MPCFTSSNFCAIMEKALKIPSVGPVMVTILSGDDPSDMLIRAPLWKHKYTIIAASILPKIELSQHINYTCCLTKDIKEIAHLLPHFLHCFSFLDSCRKL